MEKVNNMNILIGADIVPTHSNEELFSSGNVEKLIGQELLAIVKKADYRIFNLEVPLADRADPILKSGPNLIAPTKVVLGYKRLGIDLLTLANNHILDQGEQGLCTTINVLDKNGIAYVGAGYNIHKASEPYIFTVNNRCIGVFACSEHEFSIATEYSAGANPYDPLESFDSVSVLSKQCEYVIVLYHGGKESYRYPSPLLQKVCRKFIEKGADLVVCQHSHCIGCEEKYLQGTIVYGQGNFIFDGCNEECWQTGLLIQISNLKDISYIPIRKKNEGIQLAFGKDAEEILSNFKARSDAICSSDFIKENYNLLALNMQSYYLQQFKGINMSNFFIRILNKITKNKMVDGLMKITYTDIKKRRILNCLQCETHNELIKTFLCYSKMKGKNK